MYTRRLKKQSLSETMCLQQTAKERKEVVSVLHTWGPATTNDLTHWHRPLTSVGSRHNTCQRQIAATGVTCQTIA